MITISHRLTALIQRVTIWPWKNSIWHRVITQVLLYGCSTIGHQTLRIFPVGSDIKNLPACRTSRFDPWVGKIPWRRKWESTPVFLPAELHGQRSLVGYSPQGHKQLDRMECPAGSQQVGRGVLRWQIWFIKRIWKIHILASSPLPVMKWGQRIKKKKCCFIQTKLVCQLCVQPVGLSVWNSCPRMTTLGILDWAPVVFQYAAPAPSLYPQTPVPLLTFRDHSRRSCWVTILHEPQDNPRKRDCRGLGFSRSSRLRDVSGGDPRGTGWGDRGRSEAGKGRQVIKLWAPEARSCWRPVGTAQVASERSSPGVRGPGAFVSTFPSVLAWGCVWGCYFLTSKCTAKQG